LAVIAPTIILDVEDSERLIDFYEEAYSSAGSEWALYAEWRTLSAVAKAEHVIELCKEAGLEPRSTLDVGCGDGALMEELHARGFGGRLHGMEISGAAARIAAARAAVEEVATFDGATLPMADGSFDLGVLSHVLEHAPDPPALLAEVARVCRAVVFEVPLEANRSARRPAKRAHAEEIGHLHRLDRSAARRIALEAGLRGAAELADPLGLEVQRFFADTSMARAKATLKWVVRSGAHRAAPALAERLFTVHYACLCLPEDG
jgi:SAM-dependent methyltransferase